MLHILFIIVGVASVCFVLCGSLYVTSFAIFGAKRRPARANITAHTRFLIFVPAHNESSGIQATLRSIQRANYPADLIHVVVIADNCSDNTADCARACGVETWVRSDSQNRGKGQALSWAFEKISTPFDLVNIIDADTEVDPQFFAAMDVAYATSLRADRPDVVLQGRYLFAKTSRNSSWFEQFAIATKAAENSLTYRPRTSLGLANLIQGNGFCISRSALVKVPFEAISIVEDAEYAVSLALKGINVIYVDEARVLSRMTRRLKDAATQRLRWASGIFALFVSSMPRLLRGAVQQQSWKLAEMALMLLLTSRLVLVYATIASLALLFWIGPSSLFNILALAMSVALILQSIYLYLVLRKSDSAPVPFQTIAFMPLYFGFLGAVQLGAVFGWKRKQWNRTAR